MEHVESSAGLTLENEELRPLHKREVLWAICIILGLTMAPAVGEIYALYGLQ